MKEKHIYFIYSDFKNSVNFSSSFNQNKRGIFLRREKIQLCFILLLYYFVLFLYKREMNTCITNTLFRRMFLKGAKGRFNPLDRWRSNKEQRFLCLNFKGVEVYIVFSTGSDLYRLNKEGKRKHSNSSSLCALLWFNECSSFLCFGKYIPKFECNVCLFI